jgi:CRP-like cAMP-binding protein
MAISDQPPLLTFPELVQWGQAHYRDRTFNKEDFIPTRQGLIYFVHQGVVRLTSQQTNPIESERDSPPTMLGLIGADHPFEILAQPPLVFGAYAHIDQTSVIWLYWNELIQSPNLHLAILEAFRQQQQFQLLWLGLLGQKSTLDRLLSFLALLMTQDGKPIADGYHLPYPLTHAQIGSAIRATRVTITRLMVKLREKEIVWIKDDLICLSRRSFQEFKPLRSNS